MKIEAAFYGAVGARIRTLREVKGMTQQELADVVKLTRTSIVNIEQGRQRLLLHSIPRFASTLGVTAEAFMRGLWPSREGGELMEAGE